MNNTLKTLVFTCVAVLPAIALARPDGAAPPSKDAKSAEHPWKGAKPAAAPSRDTETPDCGLDTASLNSLQGMLVGMRKEMEMMRSTIVQLKAQNDMLLKIQQARPMPTDSSRKREEKKSAQ